MTTTEPKPVEPLKYWGDRAHALPLLSIGAVVVLHVLTAGIFSAVWFNRMHGLMPKLRKDDPPAGWAIGLLFVPVFNFYWVFFAYLRLCDRIDERRVVAGLPARSIKPLMTAACVLWFVPYANLAALFVFQPVVFALMQDRVNELIEHEAGRVN